MALFDIIISSMVLHFNNCISDYIFYFVFNVAQEEQHCGVVLCCVVVTYGSHIAHTQHVKWSQRALVGLGTKHTLGPAL